MIFFATTAVTLVFHPTLPKFSRFPIFDTKARVKLIDVDHYMYRLFHTQRMYYFFQQQYLQFKIKKFINNYELAWLLFLRVNQVVV